MMSVTALSIGSIITVRSRKPHALLYPDTRTAWRETLLQKQAYAKACLDSGTPTSNVNMRLPIRELQRG